MNITLENRKSFEKAVTNASRTVMTDEQRKAMWASKKGGFPGRTFAATEKNLRVYPTGMNAYTAQKAAADEISMGATSPAALSAAQELALLAKAKASTQANDAGIVIKPVSTIKPSTAPESGKEWYWSGPNGGWIQINSNLRGNSTKADPVNAKTTTGAGDPSNSQTRKVSSVPGNSMVTVDSMPSNSKPAATGKQAIARDIIRRQIQSTGQLDINGNPLEVDWSKPATLPGYVRVKVRPASSGSSSAGGPAMLRRVDEVWAGVGLPVSAKSGGYSRLNMNNPRYQSVVDSVNLAMGNRKYIREKWSLL